MSATDSDQAGGEDLDLQLAGLLEVKRFPPSEAFREQALLKDPAIYEQAAADPEAWWSTQAEQLHWFKAPEQVLDDSEPPFYKWFLGGKLNVSYSCLDRHVEAGRGERVALHWRGEEGDEREINYAELLAEVERFAGALKNIGVEQGDVVGIYLPMIPEVVVAMLACARIGAPHNVVFGGFSAEEPSVEGRLGVVENLLGRLEPVQLLGLRGPPGLWVGRRLLVDGRVLQQRLLAKGLRRREALDLEQVRELEVQILPTGLIGIGDAHVGHSTSRPRAGRG